MNPDIKQALEKELYRLGDKLISIAHWNENLVWQTASISHIDGVYNQQWIGKESLYSGCAGIILFLVELSRYTQAKQYLRAAERAMHKLLEHCRQTPSDYYAMLSGRMGVVLVALRFHKITGDIFYLQSAVQLAESSINFLQFPNLEDDLMNGTAGTLLSLLRLR
jgi:lantibiotic modifying enzyme